MKPLGDILDAPIGQPGRKGPDLSGWVFLSLFSICVGLIFRVLHWPGSFWLILVGGLFFIVFSSLQFWLGPDKKLGGLLRWLFASSIMAGVLLLSWSPVLGAKLLQGGVVLVIPILLLQLYDLMTSKND